MDWFPVFLTIAALILSQVYAFYCIHEKSELVALLHMMGSGFLLIGGVNPGVVIILNAVFGLLGLFLAGKRTGSAQ